MPTDTTQVDPTPVETPVAPAPETPAPEAPVDPAPIPPAPVDPAPTDPAPPTDPEVIVDAPVEAPLPDVGAALLNTRDAVMSWGDSGLAINIPFRNQ